MSSPQRLTWMGHEWNATKPHPWKVKARNRRRERIARRSRRANRR